MSALCLHSSANLHQLRANYIIFYSFHYLLASACHFKKLWKVCAHFVSYNCFFWPFECFDLVSFGGGGGGLGGGSLQRVTELHLGLGGEFAARKGVFAATQEMGGGGGGGGEESSSRFLFHCRTF